MKKVYSILCLFIATAVFVSCSDDDDVALSSLNNITTFDIDFEGVDSDDITYELGNSITVSVPFGTTLEGLVATITVDTLAEIVPASGIEVDYVDGEATVFTVTAEDGTTKIYNVTVNVRGEVGTGSQLDTYTNTQAWFGTSVTSYVYSEANFVVAIQKVADDWGTEVITDITFVYDEKNQIIEKTIEADKLSIVYTYNVLGHIETALSSTDGSLTDTFTYAYDTETGYLVSETRVDHTDEDSISEVSFVIENGNVTTETKYGDPYTATYDDKNNPFIGMYPKAFGAINAAIEHVNVNNPISGSLADNGVAYEYNTADYPVTASYTNYDGGNTITKTFTYVAE